MFYGADNKKLSAKMSSLENVQSLQNKLFMLNLLTASQLSKSLSAFTSQLEPQNVVRFFKCMESSCDFCTDEEDKFKDHLRAHVDPPHCTYCNELAANERLLVEHMLAEHGSCRFQCALCFYRSQTVTHMRVHGIMVHNSKAVFWYACTEKVPTSPKLVGHGKKTILVAMCARTAASGAIVQNTSLSIYQSFIQDLLQSLVTSVVHKWVVQTLLLTIIQKCTTYVHFTAFIVTLVASSTGM
ncbi:hypothetical protein MTO96_003010 [Rhipicephalus appendiculatus]